MASRALSGASTWVVMSIGTPTPNKLTPVPSKPVDWPSKVIVPSVVCDVILGCWFACWVIDKEEDTLPRSSSCPKSSRSMPTDAFNATLPSAFAVVCAVAKKVELGEPLGCTPRPTAPFAVVAPAVAAMSKPAWLCMAAGVLG